MMASVELARAVKDAEPSACAGDANDIPGRQDGTVGESSGDRIAAAHGTMLSDAVEFGLHPDVDRDVSDHELRTGYSILRDRQNQPEPCLGAHPIG